MTGVETAIAIAGVALAAVGTGVSIASGMAQADAAEDAARQEATLRETEAQSARESAAFEERSFRRRAALAMSKNNAMAAAAGLDISSGSPLFLELDNVAQSEIEALNIRRTGALSASSKEFEANMARRRASFASSQTSSMALGGAAKIGSSILGTWSQFSRRSRLSAYDYGFQG